MQSRTSFFNKTLFTKTLSRYWPLWGCASLAGAMAPLFLALSLLGSYSYKLDMTDMQQLLYGALCFAVPVITLFYAILVAMAVWNYLFNARSTGFMHTLPIDRGSLFLTGLASGLSMLLIPYVVTGGLTILIALFHGALPVVSVLETISGVIGISVFFFATATLCAMVTGNLFALPCFYFIGHFFFISLYWLVSQFAANFIFGYSQDSSAPEWIQFLTPTVNFYEVLGWDTHYNEVTHTVESVTLEGLWLVGVYTLIGIAILALSWYLYRQRHSERAGDVVAFGWLRPIFRYGVALCSALTLGQLLYEILWQIPFQNGRYYQIVPMGGCMILAGLIGYYAASMLLAKSLRVFRRSLPGVATVAALVVILCAGVSLDIFGVATTLPDKDAVDHVQLNVYGTNLEIAPDNELYDMAVALNRTIIADESYIRENDNKYNNYTYESGTEPDIRYTYIRFHYHLLDGDTLYREYRLPLTRERMEQMPDSYDYQLDRLLNGPEAIETRLTAGKGDPSTLWVYLYAGDVHTDESLTGSELDAIWAALLQDAREGNFVQEDFFGDTVAKDIGHLEFEFRRPNRVENGFYYDYDTFTITTDMTHTLKALLDNGVITYEHYQDLLLSENENSLKYSEASSFPDAAIGVIGGADGPTQVIVSH